MIELTATQYHKKFLFVKKQKNAKIDRKKIDNAKNKRGPNINLVPF